MNFHVSRDTAIDHYTVTQEIPSYMYMIQLTRLNLLNLVTPFLEEHIMLCLEQLGLMGYEKLRGADNNNWMGAEVYFSVSVRCNLPNRN